MLFYNSPHHLVVHRPETYNLQRSMTLDDYLQLQLLLQHEQEQRKQRDAWQQEQLRLQHAMANLKALKENYRRQRAMQIQQCIERYREQEARIQAQEDFYRQCLAAAIEQRRAEEVYERYQRSQKPQRRDSYEDYREQQLASVLKLLFNQTDNEDDNDEVMQDTQAKNEEEEDQEVQTLWDYITREQSHEQEDEEMQDSNEEEDEEEQEEESESEQQEEASRSPPRLAALPSSSDHHPEAYTPLFSRNDARSKEAVPVRQQASATPPLQNHVLNLKDLLDQLVSHDEEPQQQQHHAGFGKPQPIFDANESGAQDSATAQQPPPNTMTNLARELKSQSLGSTQEQEKQQKREQPPQPPKQFSKDAPQSKHNTRIFDADEPAAQPSAITQPPPANTTAHMHKEASQPQSTKPLFDLDEAAAARSSTAQPPPEHTTQNVLGDQADDNLYAPQDIRTEAEPTPLKEKTPAFPQQEQGQAQRQEKPSSRLPSTVSIKLDGISKELKSIRSREDEVLQAPLDFKEKNDTLILPATTPNNRHFLGYEDEIMRVMLKLDTIESDGDEGIRNARRALVKEAEGMLERLDEHKQREWERARRPQPSGPNKKNRKRKHKQQHHYKQPILQVS